MHTASVPTKEPGRGLSGDDAAGGLFPQEFETTFEEHYALVYRTAYGVTGRVEDAEDVVQTIFLRLLQREKPHDFVKTPAAIYTGLRSTCRSRSWRRDAAAHAPKTATKSPRRFRHGPRPR